MQYLSTVFATLLMVSSQCFAAEPDALNNEQLAKLLKEIGYEPTSLTKEVFQISVDRNGWKVHVLVSISKEADRVWLESKFAPIPEPDRVPAQTWRKLLETNDSIGPAHFVFNKTDKRIHILKAFDNHRITAERLRKEIAGLDGIIRVTYPIWRAEEFAPPRELITVAPRVQEDVKAVLAELQGEWRIVRIELRGKVANEDQLGEAKPMLTFKDDTACLKSSAESQRNVRVRLNPDGKQIDFVDEQGRVEKGIYRRAEESIVLCFAPPGADRPSNLKADDESGTWLLVLKRKP